LHMFKVGIAAPRGLGHFCEQRYDLPQLRCWRSAFGCCSRNRIGTTDMSGRLETEVLDGVCLRLLRFEATRRLLRPIASGSLNVLVQLLRLGFGRGAKLMLQQLAAHMKLTKRRGRPPLPHIELHEGAVHRLLKGIE